MIPKKKLAQQRPVGLDQFCVQFPNKKFERRIETREDTRLTKKTREG